MQSTTSTIVAGLLLVSLTACSPPNSSDIGSATQNDSANATPDDPREEDLEPPIVGAGTPEEALRSFFAAMLNGDIDSLKTFSIEHEDVGVLVEGERPPKDQLAAALEMFAKTPINSLSVGESFSVGGGSPITVTKSMVSENRKLLTMAGNPAPFPVHKTGEFWKVDPSTIIAARKTAASLSSE